MGNTLAKNSFAMPEPFFGSDEFRRELLEISSTKILQFATFEQVPYSLLWIEFWSVSRQLFQMDTFGSSCAEEFFDDIATMNRSTIPDHQQFAGNFAQEHLQKTHHIWPFVRVILGLHKQSPIQRQTTNRGEVITGQFDGQHWCLPNRCVGSYDQRQQVKTRFIYEDDGAFFLFGLFFISSEW